MELNGKKCKQMIISFLQNQPDVPRLCIDGLALDLVHSFNAQGLTLNNKLKLMGRECRNYGEKGV